MLQQVKEININEFDYDLPNERIAKFPLPNREDAKLLHYNDGKIESFTYNQLPSLLSENDHLVFNETKVVQARLFFPLREGVTIEIFCLEAWHQLSVQEAMQAKSEIKYKCMIGGAKKWKNGKLTLEQGGETLSAEKLYNEDGVFCVGFSWSADKTFAEMLELMGKTPLPPYLKRASEETDKARYQTVFAKTEGSVAAPTAGLHFTKNLLNELQEKNVGQSKLILHVGAGTFKPVNATELGNHDMHAEEFFVALAFVKEILLVHDAKNLVCVGTTSMRALESMYWLGCMLLKDHGLEESDLLVPQWIAYDSEFQKISVEEAFTAIIKYLEKAQLTFVRARTQIIIAPGYQFKLVKGLLTNFHQPRSTLLLLVSAIAGSDWKKIYEYALANEYRFLSYGDGSLLRIKS